MSLPEDLAGFTREELIELVGRLFGHIQVLEARIAELEGEPKPPTGAEGAEAGDLGQGLPARPLQGRTAEAFFHAFARRREEPTHRVEHATASCPDCQVPLIGGRVRGMPSGDYPASGTGTGNRACGVGADLPKVPEAVDP